MHEVESIELVLENCESIIIPRKYIGWFVCEGITSTVARIACNSISKHQTCKHFFIEIHKDVNQLYNSFGQESITSAFQRLSDYPDICSITITYKDGTEESCVLPWKDADEAGCNNLYQKHLISQSGHMYIAVSKKKQITDFVGLDKINDKELIAFQWEMYTEQYCTKPERSNNGK